MITPREEEPQILVPMIDIFVAYPRRRRAGGRGPGHQADGAKLLWEIEGVEYVYSIVKPGMST